MVRVFEIAGFPFHLSEFEPGFRPKFHADLEIRRQWKKCCPRPPDIVQEPEQLADEQRSFQRSHGGRIVVAQGYKSFQRPGIAAALDKDFRSFQCHFRRIFAVRKGSKKLGEFVRRAVVVTYFNKNGSGQLHHRRERGTSGSVFLCFRQQRQRAIGLPQGLIAARFPVGEIRLDSCTLSPFLMIRQ